MLRYLSVWLIFWLLCASYGMAAAPTQAQIISARATGLAWLFKNQQGDGSWKSAPGLQVQATSAALDAFINSGINTGTTYIAGTSYLMNAHPSSTDAKARQLRTLYQGGGMVVQLLQTALQSQATAGGNWGTYPGHGINIADTAMASSVLMDSVVGYQGYTYTFCYIVGTQATNGGWAYLPGYRATASNASQAGIIPTAYAIGAAQRMKNYGTGVNCDTRTYFFDTVVNSGVAFLKTKLHADGGFGEGAASSTLETALAYLAIKFVNPNDPSLANAQGYLISKQNTTNGSWGNDPFLTGLALQTLPATTLVSTAQDGVPDVVKQVLSLPAGTPYRDFKPGNGLSVVGTTAPLLLPQANQYQHFNHLLTGTGGVAPYAFALSTGLLPTGMSLSSSGAIAGIPTGSGPHSFTIKQTDSQSNVTYIVAQIQVVPSVETDTPTLPEWGAILMGMLLLGSMALKQRQQP